MIIECQNVLVNANICELFFFFIVFVLVSVKRLINFENLHSENVWAWCYRPRTWMRTIAAKHHNRNMMTSSNGNIFRVSLCDGSPPVTFPHKGQWRGGWCFFGLCLNKRLSKQSRRRWLETPSRSLWRHCNECIRLYDEVSNYSDMSRDIPLFLTMSSD